jgi:adenylosuccinate synthase
LLTAIVGTNWGDEGKGRMVDLLSADYDVICRYQGGNNAGHTVINEKGKFILNLLPSGILRESTVNVMGNGMVIDVKHLTGEIARLREKGVKITPDNLKISERAVIVMPYHVETDGLEEDRLGNKQYGSTRRGIGPVYSDKYLRKAIRMGDVLELDTLRPRFEEFVEWKSAMLVGGYGIEPLDVDGLWQYLLDYALPFKGYICDAGAYIDQAVDAGKNVLFEAQLGALRDVEFGIYPYTTSSNTLAAYAAIGAGIPGRKLDKVIGTVKAYSSSVGGGPFTVELFGEEAQKLRLAGNEFGAATGRPRRVGPFDVVASRFGVKLQGADSVVITLLDVLGYMAQIPVCTAYELDGETIDYFPYGEKLARAKPIIEYLPGWLSDISACRKKSDLPKEALDYIAFIEGKLNCPVEYVSVGPERDAYIDMGE